MAHERGLELRAVDLDKVDGVGRLLLHYVRLEFAISNNAERVVTAREGGEQGLELIGHHNKSVRTVAQAPQCVQMLCYVRYTYTRVGLGRRTFRTVSDTGTYPCSLPAYT